MAGTTLIDYVTFKTFCRLTATGNNNGQGLILLMTRYGGLVRTGAVILILSGLLMLVLVKGIWWDQLWFKLKIGLVVLLILNGMFVGNSLGLKFREMIATSPELTQHLTNIKANLNRFYLVQLTLFLLIILFSIVRPGQNTFK